MKATEAALRAALDRPGPAVRLFLLHGPDEATAAMLAGRLGAALGPEAERVDIEPATLRSDPARLADEAAALSLFGGARWIRVTGAGEESLVAVELLLGATTAGNPVVLLAPTVRASGKLVKTALAAPAALAFACYAPEGKRAEDMAAELARAEGVRMDSATLRRLIDSSDCDRAVIARELAKIALFLDAAPDRPRDADGETLAAIGADLTGTELGTIVEGVIARDPTVLGAALRTADGAQAIPWLRALQRRLASLAEMRAAIDAGEGADRVIKRHGVFWKEEGATLAALRRWSAVDIAAAHRTVRAAERAAMSGRDAARVIGDAALLRLAGR